MAAQMTSKQRLLAVLRREVPDRVPVSTYEMVGHDASSWYNTQPSYAALMDAIRDKTDCLYMCGPRWRNLGEESLREVATRREGNRTYRTVTLHTPKGDLTASTMEEDNLYTTWTTEHFLKDLDDLDRWLSIPFEPTAVDVSHIAAERDRLGDRGVMLVDVGDPICTMAELFEFGEFLVQAATNPRPIRRAMDVLIERQLAILKESLETGAGPAWRLVGPEYGSAPYMPADGFRTYVADYDRHLVELIHEHGGYVRLHCHGRVRTLLPIFIEMGCDATDPVEAPPSGDVELDEAKRLAGRKLALFGNVQLRDLEFLEPDEIERLVVRCMDAAKAGGGYVIMPTASPINAPLSDRTRDNYLRFIDAALEHGRY
jgi:uroporphyrinogen-III decarboxylase